MGFDTGGRRSRGPRHDINITPLVDVVLVLLIFFMIAVPMLMRQVVVDVPREALGEEHLERAVIASIRADLSIELDDGDRVRTIQPTELATSLRPVLDARTSTRKLVFVDFDPIVPWDDVISIIGTIRSLSTRRGVDGAIDYDEIAVAVKTRPRAAGEGL